MEEGSADERRGQWPDRHSCGIIGLLGERALRLSEHNGPNEGDTSSALGCAKNSTRVDAERSTSSIPWCSARIARFVGVDVVPR